MADRRLVVSGIALVALAATFAWLTRHPEAPWLDRVADWPVVGPLAEGFRARWRQPPPRPVAAESGEDGLEVITIWLPPPEELPALPPARPARAPAAPAASAVVPAGAAPARAPIDRSAAPVLPLPARPPSSERLARVAALLGDGAHLSTIGPYGYLGDVDPPARWPLLAAALDAAFAERTGLAPLGAPAETVVAVGSEGRYRELARLEPRLAGLDAGGHAASGLAVIRVEAAAPEAAEATLVHELTHLVARRAIGPALPPWLDEGLAEDLAWTPFEQERARFRPGSLAGTVRREGRRIELAGAWAALERLAAAAAAGRLLRIGRLVELDWDAFVAVEEAPLHYAQAQFLVRFLLDAGDPALAGGFRSYLAHVAGGGSVAPAALESALGRRLDELEPAFRAWLALRKATAVDPAVAALAGPGERVVGFR